MATCPGLAARCVSRTVTALPEDVFDVWINPKSPGGPWFGAERVILNPVLDGLFYHAVKHEGRTWTHYGRFLQIKRPHLVEHTWVSEATRGVESIVSVTFQPRDGQTEVVLRHSGVPDDEMGRQHEAGWVGSSPCSPTGSRQTDELYRLWTENGPPGDVVAPGGRGRNVVSARQERHGVGPSCGKSL